MTDRERDGLSQHDMLRDLHRAVLGDGTRDNPGLAGRMSSIEEKQKIIGWVASTALGAVILGGFNWAWAKLTGMKA